MKSAILGLLAVTLLHGCATLQTDREQPAVSLEKLVSTIQAAVAQINAGLGYRQAPRVKEATIVLKTSVGKTKEGSLSLVPVSSKRQAEDSATGTLTIQLDPSTTFRPPSDSADMAVSNRIAGAVLSAVKDLSQGNEGRAPLKFEQVSIEVSFDAEATKDGGIQINLTNGNGSLGGGRELSKSDSHVLTLVLTRN